MARKKGSTQRWMQAAVQRPGQLHRDLGIPQGKKIPVKLLKQAAKQPGKIGQRARFALIARKVRRSARGSRPFSAAELMAGFRKVT